MKELKLKRGREKSLLRRHPWIFSGAVESLSEGAASGEVVRVVDAEGTCFGLGSVSSESQIRCRMWTFDPAETIDREFFLRRVQAAWAFRRRLEMDAPLGGCRVIAAESDGLPGVVADRYADYLVVQFSSAGAERFRMEIARALLEVTGCKGIYERSDLAVRAREGLGERTGQLLGEKVPARLEIVENGLVFPVDPVEGHKTGFYLDQAQNRVRIQLLARDRDVLNCFSYTGTFAAVALAGGARSVVNVDSSAPALALAEEMLERNHFAGRVEQIEADVFAQLRKFRDMRRTFDLVILDPPKFADSQAALPRACRAYADIARLGLLSLNPGGILATFSCSGLMTPELFGSVTAQAASDANVTARVIGHFDQSADHAYSMSFPEGRYLKGLMVMRQE